MRHPAAVAMIVRRPLLETARVYDRHALRVFRCARLISDDAGRLICACSRGEQCDSPGKHPLETGWQDTSPELTRWWGLGGLWNIGIATGAASRIVVLDIDPRHGGDETLTKLEQKHGELPPTWRFLTGGGGEHILFRHPGGYVPNSANWLGQGIDVRGDGGFIVAPPSQHVSGRRYEISVHPDDTPLAPMPGWVTDRLTAKRQHQLKSEKPVQPSSGLSRYGEAALENACRRILDSGDGEQELTLNRQAYAIGRLAGAGAVPAGFALRVLKFAAQRIASHDPGHPWRSDALDQKVSRAFSDGMRNPRRTK